VSHNLSSLNIKHTMCRGSRISQFASPQKNLQRSGTHKSWDIAQALTTNLGWVSSSHGSMRTLLGLSGLEWERVSM